MTTAKCPHCHADITVSVAIAPVEDQDEALKESLSSRILFGKYYGRSVESVLKENPSYIVWASENVERFSVHPEVLAEAERNTKVQTHSKGRTFYNQHDDPDWGDDVPF